MDRYQCMTSKSHERVCICVHMSILLCLTSLRNHQKSSCLFSVGYTIHPRPLNDAISKNQSNCSTLIGPRMQM